MATSTGLKCLLIYIVISLLAFLSYTAPMNISNDPYLSRDLLLMRRSDRAGADLAGFRDTGGARIQPTETLTHYEKKGRDFFMPLIFGNVEQAEEMLHAEHGGTARKWNEIFQTQKLVGGFNGWTAHDLSQQLSQSHFMNGFTRTFNSLQVGQDEANSVQQGQNHLRSPSLQVWPHGPNRLTRMLQDRQWKKVTTAQKDQNPKEATNAYHDVIYNIRDGIMILLRQAPASDTVGKEAAQPMPPMLQMGRQAATEGAVTAGPNPMEAPKLEGQQKSDWQHFVKTWGTDQILYSEWLAQMDRKSDVGQQYEAMPPAMQEGKINTKREGLLYIFVPNVGFRQEPGDSDMLETIKRCLLSAKTNMQTPFYGEFGSFFPAGSWCTNALLSAPTNSYVANLLARHKKNWHPNKGLGHKTIVGVHIMMIDGQPAATALPTLMWEIADFKNSDVQCAQAWGRTPIGQKLPLLVDPGVGTILGKGKEKETTPGVPLECYPEVMRKWQPEAFGMGPVNDSPGSSQGSDSGNMDVDEESTGQPGQGPSAAADSDEEMGDSDGGGSSSAGTSDDSGKQAAAYALVNLQPKGPGTGGSGAAGGSRPAASFPQFRPPTA